MRVAIFVLLQLVSSVVFCRRILVTTNGPASQDLIMGRIADILAENGHDVTLLRWILLPEQTNLLKLKKAKQITVNIVEEDEQELLDLFREDFTDQLWEKDESWVSVPPFALLKKHFDAHERSCERLILNSQIQAQLKASQFDVAIIIMTDSCAFGLVEALQIKSYIWFSTAFMLESMAYHSGTAAPISYVPSMINPVTDRMTFVERVKNLFFTLFFNTIYDHFILSDGYTKIFRKHFGENFRDITEIVKDSQLLMVNVDPFFDFPRPTQHNVIYVGGLTLEAPEPLDEEWQTIVDNALPEGLVIFSMGTVANTSSMPLQYKQWFLNAFKRFPEHTFLYRLEGELPDATGVTNVIFPKWIPQKDLLANPKVKAFITHGGLNSLSEASHLGVPMILMPIFGDQAANVKRVEQKNTGRVLDKDNLSEEKIFHALNEVLNSETIQSNADRLAKMMQNKPVSALDQMLGWVNFLAEFKQLDSLKPQSRNMGVIEYYLIDVFAFLASIFILFGYGLVRTCRCCCSLMLRNNKSKAEKLSLEKPGMPASNQSFFLITHPNQPVNMEPPEMRPKSFSVLAPKPMFKSTHQPVIMSPPTTRKKSQSLVSTKPVLKPLLFYTRTVPSSAYSSPVTSPKNEDMALPKATTKKVHKIYEPKLRVDSTQVSRESLNSAYKSLKKSLRITKSLGY